MWAVPVRSATGERQTSQGNAIRKEECGKSAKAVQNELSLLPGCCFLEGREREKKKKEKEKKERFEGFESCGWGGNPTTAMDETKGKAQSKTQAEK